MAVNVLRVITLSGLLLWSSLPSLAQDEAEAVYLDSFAIQEALRKGESVATIAGRLLEAGHKPQVVAQEILLLRPEAVTEVAVTMAQHSPEEAPYVAAAISWMASSQPAPVAAAVAAAVPEMAPEVASHVAAAFPEQTSAVARAVAEVQPEQLTPIARTMGAAIPEEAAAVIRGIGPLLESPLPVVDFLVEVFAALPIPLAAFAGPQAGLVIAVEGPVEKTAGPLAEATLTLADSDSGTGSLASASSADEQPATDELVDIPLGIAVGDSVAPHDVLRSAEQGRLMIALQDGSIVTLFEQSRLRAGDTTEGTVGKPLTGTLELGVMRFASGGGKGAKSWRFGLGDGSLTVVGADLLLAHGKQSFGVVLLNGTAIWSGASGEPLSLEPGRYRSVEGTLRRSQADANVYSWLQELGLEEMDLGDLAEHSVWFASRLSTAMAHDNATLIQAP